MELGDCLVGLKLDAPVYVSMVTAVGLVLLAAWVIVHEEFFGRGYFVATMGVLALWLTMATAELTMVQLSCKLAMASATWPAIALAPITWSLFMWHFCYSVPTRIKLPMVASVALIVLAVSGVALSNPWHGLFYGPETELILTDGRPFVEFDHGPFFYVAATVLYSFMLIAFGVAILASFRASRPMRPMMMMMMFATAMPMVANVGYVVMDLTIFGFDPTPFAFSFALMILTWAIYATRGFDFASMARDLLYFKTIDPVLVVNANGVVTGVNPSASSLLPWVIPGKPLEASGPLKPILQVACCRAAGSLKREVFLADRNFEMRVLPIPRPLGGAADPLGAIAVLSDVTELQRTNAQLSDALKKMHIQLAEISRLRNVAERLAQSDPLTGIGNLRSLMARMEMLGERPLIMALIDLDHFKQINDSLGHSVGDRVLRDFASIVQRVLPPAAELFRVGGEEFVLLVPDKTISDMLTLLGSLNVALAETPPIRERDHQRLTFSAGVVARPDDGSDYETLHARADSRLYQAKRFGRNCVMHVSCTSLDDGTVNEVDDTSRDPQLDAN